MTQEELSNKIAELKEWMEQNIKDNKECYYNSFQKNKGYHLAQYEESMYIYNKFEKVFDNLIDESKPKKEEIIKDLKTLVEVLNEVSENNKKEAEKEEDTYIRGNCYGRISAYNICIKFINKIIYVYE